MCHTHLLICLLVLQQLGWSGAVSGQDVPRAAVGAKPPEVEQKYPLLARLSIPEEELPAGCKIPVNAKIPIKGVVNRKITTDPSTLILVKEELSERFQKQLRAAYYSVYKEEGEIGVMGWAFDSKESAKEAHKALIALLGDRFHWWQHDEYVIGLWRDPGTSDTCWKQFVSAIDKIIMD